LVITVGPPVTLKDLVVGARFTHAPSGNGTVFTKINNWRMSYVDPRTSAVTKITFTRNTHIVYPVIEEL